MITTLVDTFCVQLMQCALLKMSISCDTTVRILLKFYWIHSTECPNCMHLHHTLELWKGCVPVLWMFLICMQQAGQVSLNLCHPYCLIIALPADGVESPSLWHTGNLSSFKFALQFIFLFTKLEAIQVETTLSLPLHLFKHQLRNNLGYQLLIQFCIAIKNDLHFISSLPMHSWDDVP